MSLLFHRILLNRFTAYAPVCLETLESINIKHSDHVFRVRILPNWIIDLVNNPTKSNKQRVRKVTFWETRKRIMCSEILHIPIKQSWVYKFCQSISTECCRFRIQTSRYRFFRCHHYTFAERIFQCLLITPAGNSKESANSFFSHYQSQSTSVS